jgi:hypothetical protein
MSKQFPLTDINDEKKIAKEMKEASDNITKCLTGEYKRKGGEK